MIPVFDGHNDTLLSLHLPDRGQERDFFQPSPQGHIDLPRAQAGGFAGGFFAVFVPPMPEQQWDFLKLMEHSPQGYRIPLAPPLPFYYAQRMAHALVARLFRLERESAGRLRVIRSSADLADCLQKGTLGMIWHFEGAEPIDPDLDALELYYQAGLRSLGIVWSRPNAFGQGVPFQLPGSPDIGEGLSVAGKALVKACNRLGIMLDMAHLNAAGFWDVARLSDAPLVVTHSAVHALAPSARNLTDDQIDAVGQSGGLIGVTFHVMDLRADGQAQRDTPLETLVQHIDYLVQRIGVEHVAFGSDFDGAFMMEALPDVAGLPRLLAALRERGYDEAALRKLAHQNWQRVLQATWN